MLDPRIYRTGLVVVVLAVFVVAFSLANQQGPLETNLVPDAYNGSAAFSNMNTLATEYPDRQPGSVGDDALASYVASALARNGFSVSTSTFRAHTAVGTRTLETVTGTLAGTSNGSIVIVAHRDSLGSPSVADLSATATLLALSQALEGETHNHSIVLVSTSGSAGAAGAAQVAKNLSGPVDAVLVLGDLAGSTARQPILVPWSAGQPLAPPMLRNTIASALATQTTLSPGNISMTAQLSHLALPLTTGEQGPFGVHGYPALLLSMSSDHAPPAGEAVPNANQITALGRAVLQSISALDTGATVAAPGPYLLFDSKVIPAWAVRLLVLALILPVLLATIDGVARARRRGHSIVRWVIWVLASALPFALAVFAILWATMVGLIPIAPPGAVGAGVVAMHTGGIEVLAGLGCVIALSVLLLRPFLIRVVGGELRTPREPGERTNPGAAAAVLLVMCVTALIIWLSNPFAAGLTVVALHLWMWVVEPDIRVPRPLVVVALIIGVIPPVLVASYYAHSLGLSPSQFAWNGVLLIAGGGMSVATALAWSVMLGCLVSVLVIALRSLRERRPEDIPITVRGPMSYAGPGSLGGTESALRR
jgi:hypothetical protein